MKSMRRRPKYPRKQAAGLATPGRGKELQPVVPTTPPERVEATGAGAPLPTLETLVGKLKGEGYAPIHWVVNPKGIRAESTGKGKVAIPSNTTKERVCLKHGNLVKVQRETFTGRADKGARILDVIQCPFCTPDPVRAILDASVAKESGTTAPQGSRTRQNGQG